MPLKQGTFTIVPPAGMSSKSPRPPMTSKQAKKLYRQTTTPKVSPAEQRRIEAQERERIKREHERERAAERAKAAREKRQKKADEAKEMRRKMGLPEPSRWVRASQRTIVGFINVAAGAKRAREQVSDISEGNIEEGIRNTDQKLDGESAAKRVVLVQPEIEEKFGSLLNSPHPHFPKHFGAENWTRDDSGDGDNNNKTSESIRSSRRESTTSQKSSLAISRSVGPPSKEITRPNIGRRQFAVTPPSSALALEASLGIILPSPSQQVRELLEDIDDIPSNTQVAREIGADGHGISRPENLQSQLANSAQLSKPLKSARAALSESTFKSATLLQESKLGASRVQIENDNLGLEFLSSQDLVISSQDLRDINTPNRVPQLTQNSPQGYISIKKAERLPPPKTKPRFFEEKDDDLLYAAIHESLLAIKQTAHKPSRRNPPPRSRHRVPPAASNYGDEDFEMGIDHELLAVLERVEMERG